MRTTVEITDEQRARLLEIAARRGQTGFSRLVREAIDLYLASQEDQARRERIDQAVGVLGSLSPTDADALEQSVRELRERWR